MTEGVNVPVDPPTQDDFDLLPPIEVGEAFSGSYTYNDEIIPSLSVSTGLAGPLYRYSYANARPPAGFVIEIAGVTYDFTETDPDRPLAIQTVHSVDLGTTQLVATWAETFFRFGVFENRIELRLLWGADAPPSNPLAPVGVEGLRGSLFFRPRVHASQWSYFIGPISSARVVPEPTALVLLAVALGALLAARRGLGLGPTKA